MISAGMESEREKGWGRQPPEPPVDQPFGSRAELELCAHCSVLQPTWEFEFLREVGLGPAQGSSAEKVLCDPVVLVPIPRTERGFRLSKRLFILTGGVRLPPPPAY